MRVKARTWWRSGMAAAIAVLWLGTAVSAAPASGASTVTRSAVTWAETAGTSPNYIFPFMTAGYFNIPNTDQFEYYMYRPLYWFGSRSSVALNKQLSLADTPVFTNGDKTVTITLKTYKWSDGEQVDATDVMFWMNIWKNKPTGYGAWFSGGLSMPTSVTNVKVASPTTFTITFDRSFNPHWLLYNELSEITPLPLAWTKTTTAAPAGSAGCAKAAYGTDDAACNAVYVYLSEQSGFNPTKPKTAINALPTYATNPLWKVVDGPWTLASFGATAAVVFKPNDSYSGPNKPKFKEFVEKPFTTASAEFNALVAGTVDLGYLPSTDVTAPAARSGKAGQPVEPGKNNPRLGAYTLVPFYIWGINYFPYNFKSTGDTGEAGRIFSQLYVRQAIQRLFDQTLYVNRIFKGYAYPTYGPVPTLPANSFSSKTELSNPYPYSVSAAKALLVSHGWKVEPRGTSVCEKAGTGAGECGAGIRKGAKLSFTLQYATGTKAFADMMAAVQASWSSVGIHVTLSSLSFDTLVGEAVACPNGCSWEMANWLGGFEYSPDIYPSGTQIFATGAGPNRGSFTTSKYNLLVSRTELSKTTLTKYENYVEKDLPGIWQPEPVTLDEVHKTLVGATPTDPLNSLTPATYQWK